MTPQYLTSKLSTVAGQHGHATRLAQFSDLKVPQPNLELYRKIVLTIGEQLCGTAYNQALGMLIVLRLLKQATVDQDS